MPRVRGRERSVPPEEIVGEIDRYVALGFKEAVLTGTQLGSYGFDLPNLTLTGLLQRVLAETEIVRLRVSSLQAQELDEDLLGVWGDPRMCPHLHIPLQSGSDAVLRRMRRRYTAGRYIDVVKLVRETVPAASITTDVIAGFPGETSEDFQATYELCEGVGFASMHVFPYSARPGTSAAYLEGQVLAEDRSERARELLALAERGAAKFRRRQIGDVRPVLWETTTGAEGRELWSGLTDNYIRVMGESPRPLFNTITPARLV